MATHIWNLSPEQALNRRWREGRKENGPVWKGRHPLREALDEAHDLAIYLRLANGDANTLTHVVDGVCDRLRKMVKAAHEGGVDLETWEEGKDVKW